MKRGILIGFLLLAVFSMAFVCADEIKVKTYPTQSIQVSILQPDQVYSLIESFQGKSDADGNFQLTFSSSISPYDLGIWVRDGKDLVTKYRFEDLSQGSSLNILMFRGQTEIVDSFDEPENASLENNTVNGNITGEINETDNETLAQDNIIAEQITETTSDNKGITGLATSNEEDKGSILSGNAIFYVIGVMAALAILFFSVNMVRMRRELRAPREVRVRKLSEVQKEKISAKSSRTDMLEKEIKDAQKKIDEAKKEIDSLKSSKSKRIEEAKKKLIEDQQELLKLRSEEED